MTSVLVSGASIAGPTVAYWLRRYGFDVTIVEKADALRGGGYPIDIRGTALGVVDRMGLLPGLRDAHVDTRRISFLNPDGSLLTSLNPVTLTKSENADLEIRRGDLTTMLYDTIRDDVEILFTDSIAAIDDREVRFESGARRTFDLVIGADGLHSRTRGLILGPEEQYHRYIGYSFAGFGMPNRLGLSHEGVMWNVPGRAAALFAVGDTPASVHAFLNFSLPEPPLDAHRDPAAQRRLIESVFTDQEWEIPAMLDAMRASDDLFFDVVSQIHLPRWSQGRVALVGDAAYAPSFLTGQGSSLALVGAYVLAGELAAHTDHTAAFTAYEKSMRDFVEVNQAQVTAGEATMFPSTAATLERRNTMLRQLSEIPADANPAHSAMTLPDYS
ncbi:FAD-dependent monooxygenase [Cryptosporangium arvum]|uniref:2-polyprenyl-6-methoxyphenol hydroxylase-like oxidoreductase n=1 Tax=Cryptosporangium arvum DSM 44712 TaxID=927661 RepID=A0A010ZWD9_9ACTN|nr:FAD-dependent monooxygenase [Cryptosporangium arvum]EXG82984.1 2-polyprenyl-6-methoxyphenol hydroxylase-like oxidoreductase [Cryptosporangium arvum DSM 44712]